MRLTRRSVIGQAQVGIATVIAVLGIGLPVTACDGSPEPSSAQSGASVAEPVVADSVRVAELLPSAIEAADYLRVGFNGLLLPPLEDATLAKRAAEGVLSVNDLLMYSAVCGTGLDTIPLPGDSSSEQLSAILMDLAALALRLNKPLTARLMPIPGKKAGEKTEFDFDFFANSRVMAIDDELPSGLLARDEDIPIRRR